MDIAIYQYRVRDKMNGTYAIPKRMATPKFIEMAHGEIIEESKKTVDERHITPEGQEILP